MTPPTIPLPDFFDDLDASLAHLWQLLEDGPRLRRNAFHMPALATVDADGCPQVRTIVLREADRRTGILRFYCDRRSRKAAEIAASGRAALHGYDSASKVQIRVSGPATLHTDDALADTAWDGSMAMSRVCYGVAPGPGTELASGEGYSLPETDAAIAAGRPNFCAVQVSATRLEFLFLDGGDTGAPPGSETATAGRGPGWRREKPFFCFGTPLTIVIRRHSGAA